MYKVGVIADIARGLGKENFLKLMRDNGMETTMLPLDLADLSRLRDLEGIAVNEIPINDEFLENAPKLRVIVKCGVGLDSIDLDSTNRFGVKVRNMPGINKESVAELALGLMIAAGRLIVELDRSVRRGCWDKPLGTTLYRKTLGIVGTGNIGVTLAKLATAFEMRIIGYDICENEQFQDAGGKYVSFHRLLTEADFISIHVPLTKDTRFMFSDKEFDVMKNTAIVVSCARGSVIDELALHNALISGSIKGAALDVFAVEPLPIDSPLRSLNNIILQSHVGGLSDGAALDYDYATVRLMRQLLDETSRTGERNS